MIYATNLPDVRELPRRAWGAMAMRLSPRLMVSELDDPIFRSVTRRATRSDLPLEAALAALPPDSDYLDCEHMALTNVTPLLRFRQLRVLNVSATGVASLAGVAELESLEILYADFGRFAALDPLAGLSGLRSLDLSCNRADLIDLSPLSSCLRLERLYLAHGPIATITPIMHLPALRLLSIAGTLVPSEEVDHFRAIHPGCDVWP
jgi:Leucine-rich repeat (LRR) protein